MAAPDIVMYEEEFNQIKAIISKLRVDANAKVVFLVDKNGQQIAAHGEIENLDTTSLASLTAGNVAATDGLAKLIGEKEFSILFHEGERDNIHISIVAQRVILVVIFDERSSLGLVRLRVKKASQELNDVFARIMSKVEREKSPGGSGLREPLRRDHRRGHRQPVQRVGTRDERDDLHQLRVPRDQLQDRLLRPRPVREDHEPAVDLRQDQPRRPRAS